jgi:metal-responsive CopG/Arc/MetJ family transcriptional regulator
MPDMNMSTESVTITLPSNLLAQIGGDFIDREDFIRPAARHYLEYEQPVNSHNPGQVIG